MPRGRFSARPLTDSLSNASTQRWAIYKGQSRSAISIWCPIIISTSRKGLAALLPRQIIDGPSQSVQPCSMPAKVYRIWHQRGLHITLPTLDTLQCTPKFLLSHAASTWHAVVHKFTPELLVRYGYWKVQVSWLLWWNDVTPILLYNRSIGMAAASNLAYSHKGDPP